MANTLGYWSLLVKRGPVYKSTSQRKDVIETLNIS